MEPHGSQCPRHSPPQQGQGYVSPGSLQLSQGQAARQACCSLPLVPQGLEASSGPLCPPAPSPPDSPDNKGFSTTSDPSVTRGADLLRLWVRCVGGGGSRMGRWGTLEALRPGGGLCLQALPPPSPNRPQGTPNQQSLATTTRASPLNSSAVSRKHQGVLALPLSFRGATGVFDNYLLFLSSIS